LSAEGATVVLKARAKMDGQHPLEGSGEEATAAVRSERTIIFISDSAARQNHEENPLTNTPELASNRQAEAESA
jgi:hypothetical protein